MQMDRMTLKSSTIFVSVGDTTKVYRSLGEIPAPLRKQLEESTNSINSATILIADKRGREEIVRALRGLPSELRSRLTTSLASSRVRRQMPSNAKVVPPPAGSRTRFRQGVAFLRHYWAEFVVPAAVGLGIWGSLHYAGR
jgi:hypothetical protein